MTSTPTIQVAIVEDQAPLREGLALLIGGTEGMACSGHWGTMEDALRGIERAVPDVVLCDIGLPGMSGIEGVRRLSERHPGLRILMLTVFDDNEHVFEAICAGASGYLLKDLPPERLVGAIRELHEGGAPMSPQIARQVVTMFQKTAPPRDDQHRLTPRELELLQALAEGHSYKTAARALQLSIDTVRFHVRNIYEKLHVHSKSEAVILALKRGLVR